MMSASILINSVLDDSYLMKEYILDGASTKELTYKISLMIESLEQIEEWLNNEGIII